MTTPDEPMFKLLTCAHARYYSVAEALEDTSEVALRQAADLGLVEVWHKRGEQVSIGWALDHASTDQQRQMLTIHLTVAGQQQLRERLS
jgi:hypothetical protein